MPYTGFRPAAGLIRNSRQHSVISVYVTGAVRRRDGRAGTSPPTAVTVLRTAVLQLRIMDTEHDVTGVRAHSASPP
ncbi:hypothetical protein GCM10010391_19800 [Streptomyces anthocyanicus]|nr:hypothetical protein GCM10010391_19800 [Streptomyces anthocyanicus]